MSKGMSGHQSAKAQTETWLTPPHILEALGEFDLDPCSPINRPWDTAKKHYTEIDNGLIQPWEGRVWMNPPYSNDVVGIWLNKLGEHGDGIALIPARTETKNFCNYVWEVADSILFIKGRLWFYKIDGTLGRTNSGAPSVLIAYGENNVECLENCGIPGRHLLVNSTPVIVVGVSPTWKMVISLVLGKKGGEARMKEIYDLIEIVAPEKVGGNQNWKEKVRQQLQVHFKRIQRGVYSKEDICEN